MDKEGYERDNTEYNATVGTRASGNKLVSNIFGKCFLAKRGAKMGAAFQLDGRENLENSRL